MKHWISKLAASAVSVAAPLQPALVPPVAVDASNWKPVLVDSGYYKQSQIK